MSGGSDHPRLTTPRLVLRGLRAGDLDAVLHLAGEPAIAATSMSVPHPMTRYRAARWIGAHRRSWHAGRGVTFAICLRQNDGLIGSIWLALRREDRPPRLGYWVGKPYWGQGYCSEAAQETVRFGFEQMHLEQVYAVYFTRNVASGRIMRRIGMRHVEHRPRAVRYRGRLEDLDSYVITSRDFLRS